MHCMHDHSVSEAICGSGARLRLALQVEDQVARRQRQTRRRRRARLVAAAAARAGVEVDQVPRQEVGERRVAGLRLGRQRALDCRVAHRHARRTGHHVQRLGTGNRGDERQRDDAVHPPRHVPPRLGRVGAEPGRVQPAADRIAERGPDLEAGLVDRDPQRLEREAAQRQEEQQADERPVARPVGELRRPGREPPHDEEPDTDHERHAEQVEEQRVALVEGALPERPAQHRLGEVVLEREDHRAGEQHHEPVEDARVRVAAEAGPPPDPHVRQHDPERRCDARPRQGAAAGPPASHEPVDAVEEDAGREQRGEVPDRLLDAAHAGERLARRRHA